ncbi:hypothetical protein BMI90_14095 [Thioclava sp. L04-15]|uniref:tetratricopeptide repeat protein n=1 Tax=Thioclava sp. L04-15 TaxID=1915318 RepID=UPI000998D9DC|nr:SEL1-like repeat protein [Thioclava sp. L04-15]OOY27223.1 hypothetical protein BMI90_14095 [Thioclava sp. L04-15]TNE93353.1 MAG: sel1 repeat family protein [Paracoccaceae bacterium]
MRGHDFRYWMLGTALATGVLMSMTGVALAQDAATPVAPATEPAASQDATQVSPRSRAEALIYGLDGQTKDVAAGLALLETAAAQGDLPSQTSLGNLLLWGGPLPADPARGEALLSEAAAAGDSEAKLILGRQLIGGWAIPRDLDRGKGLLEELVAKGDPKAEVALAEFYLYGTGLPKDWEKAKALAEAAADKGDGQGIWKYGEMLMWSERDPKGAEAILNRAGELGAGQAYATLAEGAMYGYLGGGSVSRAKFEGYAEKARAAGNQRIEVLDAIRQMWGISMRADGPKTVEELTQASNAGNREAARYLLGLLRDGNGLNIQKDRAAAEALLKDHPELFTDSERAAMQLSIDVAKRRDPKGIAASAAVVQSRRADLSQAAAEDLFKAAPNVVIYVLQEDLKAKGLYSGKLDGLAGPLTLRGMNKLCKTVPGGLNCTDGILSRKTVGALLVNP